MTKKTRDDLKGRFKDGDKPNQEDFENLMDSFLNQLDDGISRPEGNDVPLKINSMSANSKVLNLADKDGNILWGLKTKDGLEISDKDSKICLFIKEATGEVGLSTKSPESRLHVSRNSGSADGVKIEGMLTVELKDEEKLAVKADGNEAQLLTVNNTGDLETQGIITSQSDLSIKGNSILESTLKVSKQVEFDDTLTVKEDVSLDKSVNIGEALSVDGSTTINDTLTVHNNTTLGSTDENVTTIKGKLVSSNASGHIEIADSVNITEGIIISGNAEFNTNLSVLGNTLLGENATDTLTVNSMLHAKESATFEKNITSQSFATKNLTADGPTTLNGTVSVDDKLAVQGDLSTTGAVNFTGSLKLKEGATVSEFSIDSSLANNRNSVVPTEQAVKTYVDTQNANTRLYFDSQIPSGIIWMWSGTVENVPSGWAICDGNNGTPDLRNRFIKGAKSSPEVNTTGGNSSVTLTTSNMPKHSHTVSISPDGNHDHSVTIPADAASGGLKDVGVTEEYDKETSRAYKTSTDGNHTHSASVSEVGSNSAFSIIPPYYALYYIMKLS